LRNTFKGVSNHCSNEPFRQWALENILHFARAVDYERGDYRSIDDMKPILSPRRSLPRLAQSS